MPKPTARQILAVYRRAGRVARALKAIRTIGWTNPKDPVLNLVVAEWNRAAKALLDQATGGTNA